MMVDCASRLQAMPNGRALEPLSATKVVQKCSKCSRYSSYSSKRLPGVMSLKNPLKAVSTF